MLAAESVNVPAPSLVKVPDVVPITPLIVVLPAPPTVNALAPEVAPDNVNVPASEFIRVALPRVIAPLQLFVPLMFLKAPSVEIPVPFSVNASAPTEIPPWICNAAPPVTDTPPAVVPVAVAFCMFNTPALTVVKPV